MEHVELARQRGDQVRRLPSEYLMSIQGVSKKVANIILGPKVIMNNGSSGAKFSQEALILVGNDLKYTFRNRVISRSLKDKCSRGFTQTNKLVHFFWDNPFTFYHIHLPQKNVL